MDENDDWEVVPDEEVTKRPARDDQAAGRPLFEFNLEISVGGHRHAPTTPSANQSSHIVREELDSVSWSEQAQSRIFQLPFEIRLRIYEMVMYVPADRKGIQFVHHCKRETPSVLSMLATCRRALAEAEDIFYSINRFEIQKPEQMLSLSKKRREAVRMITLPALSGATTLPLVAQLQHVPKLRSLYLKRHISIKYTDVKAWAVMSYQIATEVKKHEFLEEVVFVMPDAKDLSEFDIQRQRKLDEVDARVARAAGGLMDG
jgi:hypothetical protein